jgi:hypothetical protein
LDFRWMIRAGLGRCADAAGQTRGEVLQRLALELDTRLGDPGQHPRDTA